MMNSNSTTHYQLILDASGSMGSARIETLNAVNRQIESIREMAQRNPDQKMKISLTLFNTITHQLFNNLKPENTNLILQRQYQTEGGTSLLDAMGLAIADLTENKAPEDDVVMLVITDGEENSSQYFTFEQIANKIRKLKATEQWTFTFLGADIDAWSIANRLQFDREEVQRICKQKIGKVMDHTSESLEKYMQNKREGKRSGFLKDSD